MGLFSSRPRVEPRLQPRQTIQGHPQTRPEGPGAVQRRFRLFQACLLALRYEPLASVNAELTPVGDGMGLEDLVARIRPLFAQEPSMIYWTLLRGAIGHLYISTWDEQTRTVPFYPAVERAMGVGLLSDPEDPNRVFGVAPEWDSRVTAAQRENILGVYQSVFSLVGDYARYSAMDSGDVLKDPRLQISDTVALDMIAWAAIAVLRLDLASDEVPQPDRLEVPGWYAEPLWGKAERYWDGADWTDRSRARVDGAYRSWSAPMRAN